MTADAHPDISGRSRDEILQEVRGSDGAASRYLALSDELSEDKADPRRTVSDDSIGVAALATSVLGSLVTLALWLFQRDLFAESQGWLSLFLAVLFFGGLTALVAGIGLEYVSTLLRLAQGKPTFFIVDRSKDRLLASLAARHVPE